MAIPLGIVVPCYNEQEVLPEMNRRLLELLSHLQQTGLITADSALYFVDDGSKDQTWEIIESLATANTRVHGIKLSRNQGHQNALLAGLFGAEGDAVVTVDADLQDDIAVIAEMLQCFSAGCDIVYGVRKSRTADSAFKRSSAGMYYKFLAWMGVDMVYNHVDFRLMSRHAIDSLRQYSEVNLFLRSIIPLLGFPTATVYYARSERFAGVSNYSLRCMLALAIEGITSFSVIPLRLIAALGLLLFLLSIAMIGWALYLRLLTHAAIPGWGSSVLPIYFLGGIQLLSSGILGEYLAKIYLESKRRPRYCIEKVI